MSARFRVVLKRLGLDMTMSPYVMRHQQHHPANPRQRAAELIAFNHDTSVIEIERTYTRYLNDASDDLRVGLLADEAAPADNVVQLAREPAE